jgi:hypothetical protein
MTRADAANARCGDDNQTPNRNQRGCRCGHIPHDSRKIGTHPYDKSFFSLTAEDNRVRYYMSGSLHGFGDYVVKMIPAPDAGWGVSRPVGKETKPE